jgi:hypothetical protein
METVNKNKFSSLARSFMKETESHGSQAAKRMEGCMPKK